MSPINDKMKIKNREKKKIPYNLRMGEKTSRQQATSIIRPCSFRRSQLVSRYFEPSQRLTFILRLILPPRNQVPQTVSQLACFATGVIAQRPLMTQVQRVLSFVCHCSSGLASVSMSVCAAHATLLTGVLIRDLFRLFTTWSVDGVRPPVCRTNQLAFF